MTAAALDLLQAVAAAGCMVRLEHDMLRLSAPEPLSDDLRVRLRRHKAEIVALLSAAEPTNAVAPEGPPVQTITGVPQEVADGVRAVLSADRARGIPLQRWPQVQRDAARLVEGGWMQEAFALGWTVAHLFGCDRRAPWYRLDRSGLVLLTGGREIVELTADVAALRTPTGSVLRFRRRPPARPSLALLWDLLAPAQATAPPIRASVRRSEERMAATFLAGPRRDPDQDHPSEEDHGCFDSARYAR
jgi:hypothetical protein